MKLPVTKMAFYIRYDISVIILHLPVALFASSDENVQGRVRWCMYGREGQLVCRKCAATQFGISLGERGSWGEVGRKVTCFKRSSFNMELRFEPSCQVASNMCKWP